jgi:hypothetical protein
MEKAAIEGVRRALTQSAHATMNLQMFQATMQVRDAEKREDTEADFKGWSTVLVTELRSVLGKPVPCGHVT